MLSADPRPPAVAGALVVIRIRWQQQGRGEMEACQQSELECGPATTQHGTATPTLAEFTPREASRLLRGDISSACHGATELSRYATDRLMD